MEIGEVQDVGLKYNLGQLQYIFKFILPLRNEKIKDIKFKSQRQTKIMTMIPIFLCRWKRANKKNQSKN